jgi:hypothetical protein
MLTLDIKIKELFFDRLAVIERIGKDRARFLRNAGRYIQRTARNSMERKGKARKPPKNMNGRAYQKWLEEIDRQPSSPAGQPPYVHSDDPVRTLKNILFAFNTANQSVIVGPVGLRHKYLRGQGGIIPPELHEFGGSTVIPEKQVTFPNGGRKWVRRGSRVRPNQKTRNRRATYPARPFMAPAVAKTQSTGKFKELWFTNANAMRAAG